MDKTEKLKKIILDRYGSIRSFSKVIDIPSTTLTSAFDKGIGGMSVDRVIKICEKLDIDINTFDEVNKSNGIEWREKSLIDNYKKLNSNGKYEAEKRIEELTRLTEYTYEEPRKQKYVYEEPITMAAHDDGLTAEEKDEMNRRIEEFKKNRK